MFMLYDTDFYQWTQDTWRQIQQRDIENLDWEHLAEEIEALGNEQKHKVDSYLRQLLIHLLLYQYWQDNRDYCTEGWQDEIDEFRFQLERRLQAKSLYNYFLSQINEIYPKARRKVILKSKHKLVTLPEHCPYTVDQLLNPDFFPEA